VIGIHQFGALDEIARHDSEVVWDALQPLLSARHPVVRSLRSWERALVRRMPRRLVRTYVGARRAARYKDMPVALAVLAAPRNYAGKAYLAAKAMVTRPALARLAWVALRDAGVRRTVGVRGILEDIVKLYAVQRALVGKVGTVARV